MDEIVLIALRGLGLGSVLTFIALGFNVTFNSSGVLNFAHGGWITLGGIAGFLFLAPNPSILQWLFVGVAALVVIGVLVAIQGYFTLLPLKSSTDQHSWLVSTLAISVLLSAAILILLGPNLMRVPTPFGTVDILGAPIPGAYVTTIVLLVLWVIGLGLFHRYTTTGLAMRAIAQDLDAAKASGLHVRRLQLIAFGISGALAATAGFAAGPVLNISAYGVFPLLVDGFLAAVIGGIGNNVGAIAGGISVGLFTMFVSTYYGAEVHAVIIVLALAVILWLKPRGLFGLPAMRKV